MLQTKKHWLLSVRPAFVASVLKKTLRIRRRVVQTSAGRFFVDPASYFGNTLISEGSYEPSMLHALQGLLEDGDVFLDVGANEGFFSIVGSRLVGNSGKVLAIEPQTRLQHVIFRNIAENGAFNVNVCQLAISDAPGLATISLLPDMNSGGSGLFRATKYSTPTEEVPQTTLSKMVSFWNLDKIKLMKIDVEGFEYEAILGSKALFERNVIEHIALELHPSILSRRGKSQSHIVDFLESNGYSRNKSYETLILSKRHC